MIKNEGYSQQMLMNSSQINGMVAREREVIYDSRDSRRHGIYNRPAEEHASSKLQGFDTLALSSDEALQVIRSDRDYKEIRMSHQIWVDREYEAMYHLVIRIVAREPNMHAKTCSEILQEARRQIRNAFIKQFRSLLEVDPSLKIDRLDPNKALLELQLDLFLELYSNKSPHPTEISLEDKELHRRLIYVRAMRKQRSQVLAWVKEATEQTQKEEGIRYRKESDRVLDLRTGIWESYAKFNERNQKENTGLTVDALPLAIGSIFLPRQGQGQKQLSLPHVQSSNDTSKPAEIEQPSVREESCGNPRTQSKGRNQIQHDIQPRIQQRNHAKDTPHAQSARTEEMQVDRVGPSGSQTTNRTQFDEHGPAPVQKQVPNQALRQGRDAIDTEMTDALPPATSKHMQFQHDGARPLNNDKTPDVDASSETSGQTYSLAQSYQQFQQQLLAATEAQPLKTTAQMHVLAHSAARKSVHDQVQGHESGQTDVNGQLPLELQNTTGPEYHFVQPTQGSALIPARLRIPTDVQQSIEALEKEVVQMKPGPVAQKRAPVEIEVVIPAIKRRTALDGSRADLGATEPTSELSKDINMSSVEDTDTDPAEETIIQSQGGNAAAPSRGNTSMIPANTAQGSNSPAPGASTGIPPKGVKCHHCTKSKSRCDGKTPCNSCLKYGKLCYPLNQKPEQPRRKRGTLKKKRKTSTEVQTSSAGADVGAQEEDIAAEDVTMHDAGDEATQTENRIESEQSEEEHHSLPDVTSDLDIDNSRPLAAADGSGVGSGPGARTQTVTPKSTRTSTGSTRTSTGSAKRHATPDPNVTTRLADRKAADAQKRALRPLAHRGPGSRKS